MNDFPLDERACDGFHYAPRILYNVYEYDRPMKVLYARGESRREGVA